MGTPRFERLFSVALRSLHLNSRLAAMQRLLSVAAGRRTHTDGQFLRFACRYRLLTFDLLMLFAGRSREVIQSRRSCSQALGDTPTDCRNARENDAALA